MTCVLGIDIGTSSSKAVVCDDRGNILATASSPHTSLSPHPGWSEQDPGCWWTAAVASSREAVQRADVPPERIAAIGLSGQMHGSVLLPDSALCDGGERGRTLRPALLWNDQRTAAQCERIESAAGGRAALVEMVGNAALTGFTLPKLLWVREHEPRVWADVAAWCLPKDYVRLRLTGRLAADVGDAAGTLLFDVDQRRWSPQAHSLFDLDPALAPPVLESCAVAGELTPWAAAQTGLRPGIPVVAGSGDNQCGAAGAGVVAPGLVLATLGTSGVIYAHSDMPRKDAGNSGAPAGRVHTMCAANGTSTTPGHWSLTGCMLSAAGSLAWLHDTLFPETPYTTLLNEAAAAPAGAGGLVFLPHLTGERCPHPDPLARGAFIGLTARHTRGHLVRAVVEGVTLTMRQILDIFRSVGLSDAGQGCRIRLGGGGAKDPFWRQLQADIYGETVELPNTEEGPAFGAALMAGVGAGLWADLNEACCASIRVTETRDPDPNTAGRYNDLLEEYGKLYPSLAGPCRALASFDT